jgi:SAM-dependent methyltransferase
VAPFHELARSFASGIARFAGQTRPQSGRLTGGDRGPGLEPTLAGPRPVTSVQGDVALQLTEPRSVPEFSVHLDEPREPKLQSPMEYLWGWIRVPDSSGSFDVRVNGERPQFARIARTDLAPECHVGFLVCVDLVELASLGRATLDGKVTVDFYMDDAPISSLSMSVDSTATHQLAGLIENRRAKREFILANTTRPLHVPNGCRALSNLPAGWPIDPAIRSKSDAISSHGYSTDIHEFLSTLPKDAMVLDAGAGFRRHPHKNVINMEIYDYPSTDILSIGQDLPFRDGVFDGIISVAVLEHVDDPFLCASELGRVLKPGGKIYCCIPFLQAEHGYPSHFFNCTRFGIRRLFSSLNLDRHYLEAANQPIFTIHQILGHYAHGLPCGIRERFLGMTVEELIKEPPFDRYVRNDELITALDPEERWKIAWGTTAIFSKPAA